MSDSGEKNCSKCEEVKSLDEFYIRTTSADGYNNLCKECIGKSVKGYSATAKGKEVSRRAVEKYRLTDKGKKVKREAVKRFFKTHKGKKANKKAGDKFIKKYPYKIKAQRLLQYAVLSGTVLKPEKCEVCNINPSLSGNKLHGHHDDYSKPLEVNWVCPQCHSDIHNKIKKDLYEFIPLVQ